MIKIITDSSCDITQAEAKLLNIEVIPLTIVFQKEEYLDGVDMNHQEFYARLASSSKLPTTSQIPPSTFEHVFQKYDSSKDEIIGIFLSSELSGTLQSAHIAASNLEQTNIHLIDSKNVSIGTSLLIREAVKLRDQGLDVQSIVSICTELTQKIRTVAVVNTLKYLKMGGRLSASEAMLGSLLHINPIIAVVDGKIQVISKARGLKSAMNLLYKMLKESPADISHTIVYGSAAATDTMQDLIHKTDELTSGITITKDSIGSAVGTHVGPGAFGFAYIPKHCASMSKTASAMSIA